MDCHSWDYDDDRCLALGNEPSAKGAGEMVPLLRGSSDDDLVGVLFSGESK